MSFNGLFTISQGTDTTSFTITDASTGSDPNLTGRRVYLFLSDGTTLTPEGSSTDYIDWPLVAGATLTLTGILSRDYSLNIQVQWLSSSPLPSPSTYIFSELNTFTENSMLFEYGLTQMQAGNPLLIEDNNWFANRIKLSVFVNDAQLSESFNDQYNSQLSLNAAYKMQQNANTLF